jgi:hypothetical protein
LIRRALPLLLLTTLLGGCGGDLGRATPECGPGSSTSSILQIQAVPEAAWVPCIESLPVGWEYNHLQAQSGLSEFTLDSDRMGDEFVTVRTSERCDLGGTRQQESPIDGILLFSDIQADLTVPIVFIPEGPTDATIDAAQAVMTGLIGRTLDGRRIDVEIDRTGGSTETRITNAQRDGANVFVIGLREAEEGTVTVILKDHDDEVTTTVENALEMIDRTVEPPSYRGSWMHVFEGGCIEYRFDAHGPETLTLENRIRRTLGFTDAEAVRDIGRSLGYDI